MRRIKAVDLFIILLILLTSVGSVLISSGLPGLYLDAVNPDYYAVYLLYHNKDSATWILPNLGVGFLGQMYHGILTVPGMIIAHLITGTTSVLQLRIVNSLYGAAICSLIYSILLKLKVRRYVDAIVALTCAASPVLVGSYRTQYYIELPGMVLFLISFYILVGMYVDGISFLSGRTTIAGFLAGLAFYGYFNFLFFLPGFLFVLIFLSREKKSFVQVVIHFLVGYAIGSILYFAGYAMIVINSKLEISIRGKALVLLGLIMVYMIFIFCVYICNREKRYVPLVAAGGCLVGFVFGIALLTVKSMSGYLDGLNVAGSPGSISERINRVIGFFGQICGFSPMEYLVMYRDVMVFRYWMISVLAWMLLVTVILIAVKRFEKNDNQSHVLISILIMIVMYGCCAIFMATRMQGQHFVPMLPLFHIIIGICIDCIISSFKQNVIVVALSVLLCGSVLVLNIVNQGIVWKEMAIVGKSANTYYSSAIESLSDKALKNLNSGIKEYYIFPEWGIALGFEYLTQNKVALADSIKPERIKFLYDKGYEVKICFWDEANLFMYEDNLKEILGDDLIMELTYETSEFGGDICIISIER